MTLSLLVSTSLTLLYPPWPSHHALSMPVLSLFSLSRMLFLQHNKLLNITQNFHQLSISLQGLPRPPYLILQFDTYSAPTEYLWSFLLYSAFSVFHDMWVECKLPIGKFSVYITAISPTLSMCLLCNHFFFMLNSLFCVIAVAFLSDTGTK